MESWISMDVLRLLAVVLLVLVNAFFVAAEFALVSLRRTRVAELVDENGDAAAMALQKAFEHPEQMFAAMQLGITLASLGLGWIGEPVLAPLFAPLVALFPPDARPALSGGFAAVFAFIVITLLHVILGELAPKTIALQNPEGLSLAVARPALWIAQVLRPVTWVLNKILNAVLGVFGIRPASDPFQIHSVAELKMLVTASAEGGVVEAEESQMLHNVFDIGELVVRQIMVPRTEIVAVEADTPLPEIINLVTQFNYTKFPVYEENLDQILGIVHVKDLLGAMQNGACQGCTARDFIREAIYIPESTPINALLRHFRDNRQHIAIVMDEYGGNAGLVTLEDVLEEIVGEVGDPFDVSSPEIYIDTDGTIMIEGLTLIEEVNQRLSLNLQDPYYDTIAGYVLGRLGRIPRLHDYVKGDGVGLRVEEMDGMRIARVSLERLQASPAAATGKSKPVKKPAKNGRM
ncbi:MAG: HlyC/CorC family transporter [Chloroflexi bacterium]|jgi:CBS domain containing-hemolysin-like protein|nr:HlyC/CorC family transporter [Chloroflexota bacterium]